MELAAMDYDPNSSSKLFDVPITISNSILSNPCDCKRRKTRNSYEELSIMDLPTVIIMDIISRLPIKSILCCKCVCKPWYTLSSDPLFIKMHHTRSSRSPCLWLSNDYDSITLILELKAHLDYSSDPENRPIMLCPVYKFCDSFRNFELEMIGSCNGFFCFINIIQTFDSFHIFYISNPLLGEYFKFKLPGGEMRNCDFAHRFCFSEASGQYKLLRSVTSRKGSGDMEVFTLGVDKKWRNVGEASCPPVDKSFGDVNVNGSLHWLDSKKVGEMASIFSFDIGTEKVKSMPPPPVMSKEFSSFALSELWNCLCLIDCNYGFDDRHVDIWRMKEYDISESWTKCYHILFEGYDAPDIFLDTYKSIVIWRDGEILMGSEPYEELVSYNPKEKLFRKVNIYGGYRGGRVATKFVPSFYSVKAVMGATFKYQKFV